MPIKINVPFSDKDTAKQLGAIWIPDIKTWSIPNTVVDINPFQPWLPQYEGFIVKSPHTVIKNSRYCWKCKQETPLIALGSRNFYAFNPDGPKEYPWVKHESPILFQNIYILDKDLSDILQQHYPFFQQTYSKTQNAKVWANTCIHCQALQGDYFNFDEPGGPFCPLSAGEAAKLQTESLKLRFDYHIQSAYSQSEIYDWIRF